MLMMVEMIVQGGACHCVVEPGEDDDDDEGGVESKVAMMLMI